MRALRVTLFALTTAGLVACGDNGGSNPPVDAPVSIDGRVVDAMDIDAANIDATDVDAADVDAASIDAADIDAASIDAAVDAAVDAPSIDAPPAPMNTVVWAFGDIATNNLGQVGYFTHPQAGAVTPTFVPATGQTPVNNFPTPFSVAADNSAVAYVAGASGTGPWTVSLAAGDGSGAIDVFAAAAGATITDVALSPDKTKIAFRGDLELTGQFDVYVVPALAGQTPVKVSPDRSDTTLDAQGFLSWSADSRYLAFGGAFTTAGENEVRIRDTMAGTTAVALSDTTIMAPDAPRGLLLAPQWTATGTLVFAARVTMLGERQLYSVAADGTGFAVLPNSIITRGDTTMSQAPTFGLSPDGTRIAFAADGIVAGAYEVYVMPVSGATAPVRLTAGTVPTGRGLDQFRLMRWNPAGTAVAYGADHGATDDKFQPYVADVVAGTVHRLATIGTDTDAARDVQTMAWSHDGAFVYAIGDGGAADNDFELYALDATMTDQTPGLRIDPPTGGDVFDVVTRFVP